MAEKIDVAQLNVQFVGDTSDLTKGIENATRIVKAGFDKTRVAASKISTAVNKTGDAFRDAGKRISDLDVDLQQVEQAYGQFKQTLNGAIDLAQLGAQSERIEDRFGKFAATIGDADTILAAFNRGSGETVDKLTAMNAASQLIQQGLVGTSAEMEKTVELATRLGNQTDTATDRINKFSQLLRNQSIQLLDDFGISSGRARDQIKELQAADADLTREEAFRQVVFAEGQKSLDILGERVEDNAIKMERAQARMQDFRVEMGEKLVPVVAKGAEFISKLDTATIALITSYAGAIGIAAKFSGGIEGLAANFGKLATKMGTSQLALGGLVVGIGVLIERWSVLQSQMDKMQDSFDASQDAASKLADPLKDLAIGTEEWDTALADIVDSMGKANQAYEGSAIASGIIGEALGADAEFAVAMGVALSEIDRELQRGSDTYNAYVENVNAANQALEKTGQTIVAVDRASFEMHQRIAQGKEAWEELTHAQKKNQNEIAAQIASVQGLTWEEIQAKVATEQAAAAIEEQNKTLERSDGVWKNAIANQERGTQRAAQMTTVTEELSTQIQAQGGALEEQQAQAEETARLNDEITASVEEQTAAFEESMQLARERIDLQREEIQSQLDRSEALKGAGEEEIARTAIKELEKAQQAGLITFDDYTKAVVEIQDRFGLADDRSRALTLGIGELVNEFISGGFAATEMDDALDLLIKDAEDGIVAFDKLKQQITDVGTATAETERIFNGLTGQFEDVAMGGGGERTFNAATGQFEAAGAGTQQQQGAQIIDGLTGQVVSAPQQAPTGGGGGVNIYGGLHLEGIRDVEGFLAQLQALTPQG